MKSSEEKKATLSGSLSTSEKQSNPPPHTAPLKKDTSQQNAPIRTVQQKADKKTSININNAILKDTVIVQGDNNTVYMNKQTLIPTPSETQTRTQRTFTTSKLVPRPTDYTTIQLAQQAYEKNGGKPPKG